MFDSIGWGEILVLIVAGLFILGPERLPSAAAWTGRAIRQVREYATGAREQLRGELGPKFDELRKPLEDLRSLRDLNPRNAVRRHLFEDPEPGTKQNGYAPEPPAAPATPPPAPTTQPATSRPATSHPVAGGVDAEEPRPARPPIDPDAT